MKKKFIIIDAHALIHRAYHALPPLTTKRGELVNAVYGFLLVLLKVLKEFQPDFIAAAFDVPEPTFRHKEFEEYKAKRPKAPDELYNQIPRVKQLLKAFHVPIYEKAGFEADDVIGRITELIPKKQVFPEVEIIIVTGDLDTLQLIDKNTKVYTLRKGMQDTVIYDEKQVFERYGLKPEQVPDFKGLKGDPSDNIPGVPGVGEKTAIELLKEYGTLENLYKNIKKPCLPASRDPQKYSEKIKEKLIQYKDQAFFSKMLATIRKDVPLKFNLRDAEYKNFNTEEVKDLLKELEFYSLVEKIPVETKKSSTKKENNFTPSLITRGGQGVIKEKALEEIEKLYKDKVFSKEVYEMEKSLVPVMKEMQKNGIKVDQKQLEKISKELEGKIQALRSKIYKLAGAQFNINSPQQLSEIIFRKLNIPTMGLKKTPGGVVSTSAGELEKLEGKHLIIKFIQDYRQLAKLKTGFVDALPKLIDSRDGRIHPQFHQLGTATGRISCSDPNLQNIPIRGKWGKEIRRAFIIEEGFSLASFDYSQMELRIAAHIANDRKMIEAFRKGEDIHRITAAEINNISQDEVTEKLRDQAKTLNFGLLYGISVYGFAKSAKVSYEKAKIFFDEYTNDFKGIAAYIIKTKKEVRKNGYVETFFGRKRFIPEINSRDNNLRLAAERMAINQPIQGSAADIIKLAMNSINQYIEETKLYDQVRLLLQIHDELLFEIKNDTIKEVVFKIKDIMENICKLKVPLEVNAKVGRNWGDMVECNLDN